MSEGYTVVPDMTEQTQTTMDMVESVIISSEPQQPPAAVEAPAVLMPVEIPAAAVIPEQAPVANALSDGHVAAVGHALPSVVERRRRESKRLKHHKRRKKKKLPIKRLKIKPLPPPPAG